MTDTELPWFCHVPKHWKIRRLKTLCNMKSGYGITEDSIEPEGTYPVYGGNGIRGYASGYTHDGDFVLIGRQGAQCGNVHIAHGKFWASEHAVVAATRNNGCSPEWLSSILEVVNLNQYSIAAAQPGLSVERVLNIPIPVPPAREQAALIRLLDRVKWRIGCYVSAKHKINALLQEYRQTIIHQVVTGRVDVQTGRQYSMYRPSGVAWLSSVPAMWEIWPLRARYTQCLGKMLDSKRVTGRHSVPYLRNTDVQWDGLNTDDLPMMDITPSEYDRYTVQRGDLIVCEGGEVGRCAIWSAELPVCGFQKALHRLRPKYPGKDLPRFMYYMLRSAAVRDAFADGHVSTIPHLTGDKLRAHRFPFPPLDVQTEIVQYLDTVTAQVDNAIYQNQVKIKLAEEYGLRLAADLLTGRTDLTKSINSSLDRETRFQRTVAEQVDKGRQE